MDLASLQISIKETGAEASIKKLDSLRESAKKLNLAINTLNKKTGKGKAFYKGIESIGEVAAIASKSVKTLKDQLNSIGVNKLSDLIKASNQLSEAGNKAAKGIAAAKIGLEKAAQEARKTALAEEKVTTEKERQKRIAAQTLAIERQSNQTIQNSVLLTESKVSRQNALSVMETLRGKQKLAVGDAAALKANAVAEERLKVATNDTTTSIIHQETALKNHENAVARATLAQNRLDRQQEISDYHLKKHTQSWLQHWRSVASGIVLYQGIRSGISLIVKGFSEGIAAVDDFQVSAIQLAAVLTTMAKEGDPIANFQEASRYAEALIPVLQKIDIRTSLNLQNLKDITLEMAKQGVVLDATNEKQVEGFTRIANAVALYSRNGQDNRQLQQEVRALFQGQYRDTDQLGKLLHSILGDSLKPTLKIWKEEGLVIEKIGELLKGFGPANDKLSNTWSAVKASTKTVFDIIARLTLTPVLEGWVKLLGQFNAYLIENKDKIADVIQNGWKPINDVINIFIDNGWIVNTLLFTIGESFNTLSTIVSASAKIINSSLQDIGKLTKAAFGKRSQEDIENYGNNWEIAAGIIAGAATVITKAMYAAMASIKLLGNAFVTTLDMSSKAAAFGAFGNPLDAFALGVERQKSILDEYTKNVYAAQKDYEKRLGAIHEIYNNKKDAGGKDGDGKLSFKTNTPAVDGDSGTRALARKYADALLRVDDLLNSVTAKQSDYDTEVAKYQEILNKVTKLENERIKYGKDVITSEQVKTIKEAAKANLEYSLALKAGGEKGNVAELNRALETLKKYYEGDEKLKIQSFLTTEEYERKKYELIRDFTTKSMDYKLAIEAGGSKGIQAELALQLQDYIQFRDSKYLTDEEYNYKRLTATTAANRKLIELDNSTIGIMKQATMEWSDSWSSTMNDMYWGAETSFAQILESFGKMITQMLIQKQLVEPLVGSISGLFTGGVDSAISSAITSNPSIFANGGIMTSNGQLPLRAYAAGGIANSPQVSVFGEGSMAEAYVPLPDGRSIPVTMNSNQQPVKPQNIKVEIVNESNEQLQTKSAEVTQDPSGMILSIVIDGITRNKMGMRDLISAK